MTDDPSAPGDPASTGDGKVAREGHHYAVTITVDGQSVPLKVFLHDLIGGAVSGLLKGLHNVPDEPSDIEIEVHRL